MFVAIMSRNAVYLAIPVFRIKNKHLRIHLLPDQITFLDEVVEYLVKNGTMEPKVMFDAPFTHINDQGITGVFDETESKKVVELVRHINNNAVEIKKAM